MFNALNGSTICLGALLGGYLAPHLPPLFGHKLLTLFLISGLSRGLVVSILLPQIAEVRQVTKTRTTELLFGKPSATGSGVASPTSYLPYIISKKTRKLTPVFRFTPVWWQELTSENHRPPVTALSTAEQETSSPRSLTISSV